MTDLNEIYKKARALNLQNIAHGNIDLNIETVSNLDFLDYVLTRELEERAKRSIQKKSGASRLPNKEYAPERVSKGIAWQIDKYKDMEWINTEQNLVIIGRCDTGKTTIATHIGRMAINNNHRVYYCNIEEFLRVIKDKEKSQKTMKIYKYMLDSSVIIIDDVMYANILANDLPIFYRAISFLNEARSLIIITNRDLSSWIDVASDTHLMQTLVDRITSNSQIIRL